jgi:hypothetical protein
MIYQITGTEDQHGLLFKSIEAFQQAINIKEDFVSSRFHLGLIYHKTN